MTTRLPPALSILRVAFWQSAAVVAELALQNRIGMLRAWPYLALAGGGLAAYAAGRLVGVLALGVVP